MAPVSRRAVLQAMAGAGAILATGGLLDACTSQPQPSGGLPTAGITPPPGGPVSLGSNQSDAAPKAAMQQVVDAFTAATGIVVNVSTTDNATFEKRISTYVQGRPDDVFTWFAGYRMRVLANQGLTGDLTDVWSEIGADFTDAYRLVATADDAKPYFVPFYNYPWVFLYRRSLWEQHGYQPPKTWSELLALGDRMQADGLVPIAFGDKEGWPAMGYFDILNMRLNGYDFHIGLMDGREKWTDPRVKAVFERWRLLLPYLQPAAETRSLQEAAQSMLNQDAGMLFAGTTAGEEATDEQLSDLDLLEFPLLGTSFDAEKAVDAPTDGFMMKKQPADAEATKRFLKYLGSGRAQDVFISANPSYVATANDALRVDYSPFQRRMAEIIAAAGRIAGFMDRDTRPDFADATGMQLFLGDFLTDPEGDLDALLGRIQAQWDSLT
jgi:multiple sugar transport system substrate-binding protein